MKTQISLCVILSLLASPVFAESQCAKDAEGVLKEVENDGGTEFETLVALDEICAKEYRLGKFESDEAYQALEEVRSHIDSWKEMKMMLRTPPESMKKELKTNRPEIAETLKRDLARLVEALE